jgi:hypothetical protein
MTVDKKKEDQEEPLLLENNEEGLEIKHHKLTCAELKEIFDKLADGKTYVTAPKLILALRKYPKIAEILEVPSDIKQEGGTRDIFEEWFRSIDTDDSRTIDWEEFMALADENLEEEVYVPSNTFTFRVKKVWKNVKKPFVKCMQKPKIDKTDEPVPEDPTLIKDEEPVEEPKGAEQEPKSEII